jgi:hypothetical protein
MLAVPVPTTPRASVHKNADARDFLLRDAAVRYFGLRRFSAAFVFPFPILLNPAQNQNSGIDTIVAGNYCLETDFANSETQRRG